MPSSRFVQVVFGLLVVATAAAFFVAQALKRAPAVVERLSYPRFVSPNGDGRHDRAPIRFVLRERQRVTVSVVDETGTPVRRLVEGRVLPGGRPTVVAWDGRTNTGRVARDGGYRLRVELPTQGRAVTAGRTLTLDTRPPRPRLVSVRPTLVVPRPPTPVRIRFRGPVHAPPLVRVFRTDRGAPRIVDSFRGQRRRRVAVWAPRVRGAAAPPEGTYAFTVTVRDRAGNAGTAPGRVPARGAARPGTGVTVDALSLSGPLEPVAPGAFVRLAIAPRPATAVRWRLQRLGARRALARGRGGGAGVIVRVPSRARTGLHLVHVTGAGGRAVHPLVVRRAPARSRRLPLVVVPAITWAGRNPVDDDRDGFPDTLETGSPVALARPFLHRAPPGLASAGAVLRLLDDTRVRYDMTTDLALARAPGARLTGRPALVFPGDERWLPAPLLERLRAYVRAGGQLVSFGAGAFRRRVVVTPDRLQRPTPPAPADAFGERLALVRTEQTPMTVFEDELGVLAAAAGGAFGRFTRLEVSLALDPRARRLAAAGRDADRPAFIAYRLGGGTVVRVGSPQWGLAARERADVAEITRTLLRRTRR